MGRTIEATLWSFGGNVTVMKNIIAIALAAFLSGCASANKKAQEIIFEVSFYSPARKASPLISLRGDNKMFVVWTKLNRGVYEYDGKFFETHPDDAAVLKEGAREIFKLGATNSISNCTNGVVVTVNLPKQNERREFCARPGRDKATDEFFSSVNDLLPENQKIAWK